MMMIIFIMIDNNDNHKAENLIKGSMRSQR